MIINNIKFFIKYENAILKIFSFINFSGFKISINILLIICEFIVIFDYLFHLLSSIHLLISFFIIKNIITFIYIFNLKYI